MSDFWEAAFGGKDILRLSLGAYNLRTRKNIKSITRSFEYGEGKRIKIVEKTSVFNDTYWYLIEGEQGTLAAFGLSHLRSRIEELTGLSLDLFVHG